MKKELHILVHCIVHVYLYIINVIGFHFWFEGKISVVIVFVPVVLYLKLFFTSTNNYKCFSFTGHSIERRNI